VLLNSVSIRLAHNMPFPGNTMFPIGCFGLLLATYIIYGPAGDVVAESRKFGGNLGCTTNKETRVIAESLRPLRINVLSGFYIQRSTFVEYERQILDYTITVLLMIN
ncbi:unnamed protein product, partial [Allacma fusca]